MVVTHPRTPAMFLSLALLIGACTAGDGAEQGDVSSTADTMAETEPDEPEASDTVDAAPDAADAATVASLLGFDVERFEVPIPEPGITWAPFDGVDELIDAGVDAGTWSEVEAGRALLSVMIGAEEPELVAGFDELTHPSMHLLEVVERLLADPSVDAAQHEDLALLSRFFFEPDVVDRVTEEVGATTGEPMADDAAEGLVGPRGFAPRALQATCPGTARQIDESVLFGAQIARDDDGRPLRYCKEQRGDDIIFYPESYDFGSDPALGQKAAERFFQLIEKARSVYRERAASELQPVFFLISPRTGPDGSTALAHVLGRSSASRCVGAILLSEFVFDEGPMLEHTMAHELFHCIQATWGGGELTKFVGEGGADYFANLVVPEAKCSALNLGNGRAIDPRTANGSLLDATYDGWMFWDYLETFGGLSSVRISEMHQTMQASGAVGEVLNEFLDDPSRRINEFYVRLMGPGLACELRGSNYTDDRTIEDVGEEVFADADWQGTRYRLTYPEMRYFELEAGDGEVIGMAEIDRAADEAAWVVVAPEVRSSCEEPAEWAVVFARSPLAGAPTADRRLQVTDRQDTDCDPCPVGDWSFDLASMADFFESFDQGSGAEVAISGSWTLEFLGSRSGGPTMVSDDQDVVLTFTIQGNSLPVAVSGGGSGSWTGDESTLGLPSYQSTGQASLFDLTTSVSETGAAALAYSCEDGEMTFEANGTTITLSRQVDEGDKYFG